MLIVVILMSLSNYVRYDKSDRAFAHSLAKFIDSDHYEIKSLDVYYLKDTGMYYYNVKYRTCIESYEDWNDFDAVFYGTYGLIENVYYLSWDQLYEFEEVNEEFKEAQKSGIHKEYDPDDVIKMIEEALKEK